MEAKSALVELIKLCARKKEKSAVCYQVEWKISGDAKASKKPPFRTWEREQDVLLLFEGYTKLGGHQSNPCDWLKSFFARVALENEKDPDSPFAQIEAPSDIFGSCTVDLFTAKRVNKEREKKEKEEKEGKEKNEITKKEAPAVVGKKQLKRLEKEKELEEKERLKQLVEANVVGWFVTADEELFSHLAGLPTPVKQVIAEQIEGGFTSASFKVAVHMLDSKAFYYFVKLNPTWSDGVGLDIFVKEKQSLELLMAVVPELKVPKVYGLGVHTTTGEDKTAYLLMEYLPLQPSTLDKGVPARDWYAFGRNLAVAHRDSARRAREAGVAFQSQGYGLSEDTYRGILPMPNQWRSDWISFFRELRLAPLVAMVDETCRQGFPEHFRLTVTVKRLMACLPVFFDDIINEEEGKEKEKGSGREEEGLLFPSLLHGDLKRSNWAFLMNDDQGENEEESQVVWFDPTLFWGHHEMELAVMPLFGGPSAPEFWEGYHAVLPKRAKFQTRQLLYQLHDHLQCLAVTKHPVFLKRAESKSATLWDEVKAHPSFRLGKFSMHPSLVPTNRVLQKDEGKKNVVLVLCGSFCPVHLNHVKTLQLVREHIECHHSDTHKVVAGYLSPAPDHTLRKKFKPAASPSKTTPSQKPKYIPIYHRTRLCELAVEDSDWISVCQLLLMGGGLMAAIKHTIQHHLQSDVEVMYVCGSDSWENVNRLLPRQYAVACVGRKGYTLDISEGSVEGGREVLWVPNEGEKGVSSTKVREAMLRGNKEQACSMLNSKVVEYFVSENLMKYLK